MESSVHVSFRREPDYFLGARVQGDSAQIIVFEKYDSKEIIGVGSLVHQEVYLQSKPTSMGYLTDLRLHPYFQKGFLLARGYRYLQSLHEKSPMPFYTSLILKENRTARAVLTRGRAGLPLYKPLAEIFTPLLLLRKKSPPYLQPASLELVDGPEAGWEAICEFLNQRFREENLAPVLRKGDFESGRFVGLSLEDFKLLRRKDFPKSWLGCGAVWDPSGYRQIVVEKLGPSFRILKAFYSPLRRVFSLPPLPKEGEKIPTSTLSFFCPVYEGNTFNYEASQFLFHSLYEKARQNGSSFLIAGGVSSDWMKALTRPYLSIPSGGTLYQVCLGNSPELTGPFRIEMGLT